MLLRPLGVVTLLLFDLPTTILRYRFVLTFSFLPFFNSIAGEKDYRDVGLRGAQVQRCRSGGASNRAELRAAEKLQHT